MYFPHVVGVEVSFLSSCPVAFIAVVVFKTVERLARACKIQQHEFILAYCISLRTTKTGLLITCTKSVMFLYRYRYYK